MKKLKVGFLIDETDVSYYIADLIRHVEDSDLFESPTLITGYEKTHQGRLVKNLFLFWIQIRSKLPTAYLKLF